MRLLSRITVLLRHHLLGQVVGQGDGRAKPDGRPELCSRVEAEHPEDAAAFKARGCFCRLAFEDGDVFFGKGCDGGVPRAGMACVNFDESSECAHVSIK